MRCLSHCLFCTASDEAMPSLQRADLPGSIGTFLGPVPVQNNSCFAAEHAFHGMCRFLCCSAESMLDGCKVPRWWMLKATEYCIQACSFGARPCPSWNSRRRCWCRCCRISASFWRGLWPRSSPACAEASLLTRWAWARPCR